ncbi:TIR domain-containing protein [Prosthecobacter sp.]|uniref:TIR domain-containing protein n=1 Tax=Prosthecobacter sp. TaxID=1965333 RepID=UPI003BB0CFD6
MPSNATVVREELIDIVRKLDATIDSPKLKKLEEAGERLKKVGNDADRAFSGSWMGDHSTIYYKGIKQPPPGASFDSEWGLVHGVQDGWLLYDPHELKLLMYENAEIEDRDALNLSVESTCDSFADSRSAIISCLSVYAQSNTDRFLDGIRTEVEGKSLPSKTTFIELRRPKSFFTRDSSAVSQGQRIPPHMHILSEAFRIVAILNANRHLRRLAANAASHLDRVQSMTETKAKTGTTVFIGHGRSQLWRQLKDFIQDRLHLPYDEFNRVSPAGTTTVARLESMLDEACFAFLILTAEDELSDLTKHPRMNVVHELGLFQGRLGFSRAIILKEEGCAEFSNIIGLTHISFPSGNIQACFEQIRQVLEREGLLK